MRGSSFFGKMQSLHSYQYSHSMFKQWVARERYWLIFTEWVILSIWLLSITLEQMPWCPIQLVHLHISNLPILPVSCSWLTNQAICPCPETCMYPYLWTLLPYKAKNQVYHLYLCPLEGFPSLCPWRSILNNYNVTTVHFFFLQYNDPTHPWTRHMNLPLLPLDHLEATVETCAWIEEKALVPQGWHPLDLLGPHLYEPFSVMQRIVAAPYDSVVMTMSSWWATLLSSSLGIIWSVSTMSWSPSWNLFSYGEWLPAIGGMIISRTLSVWAVTLLLALVRD